MLEAHSVQSVVCWFTQNKLVDGALIKGLHKPLVPMEIIEKNRDILSGRKKNYVI